MDVAVMYSGGKDSTYAIQHCLSKGWTIKYLLSVKPTRTDCYLFHFATVEYTKELSSILGLDHIYTTCDAADPKEEAHLIKEIVRENMVDALVLGGVGLQETQINSLRDALFDLGVEVFAAHTGRDHTELIDDMIKQGYDIRITQIAADGLTKAWLGKKLDGLTFSKLKQLATTFGFHIGAEGGHYDTLVVDGPLFQRRLEIIDAEPVMDSPCSGYLKVKKIALIEKEHAAQPVY
jgi:diphthine-ammonia ligase